MAEKGPHEWSPRDRAPGTLGGFIYQNKITLQYVPISQRPDRTASPTKEEQQWQDSAFHYKVTLKHGPKRFTTFYSAGSGAPEPPEADEVLDSLASEASSYEDSRDFEDWAANNEYDTDSRRAERMYHAVKGIAEKLKNFLGEDLYKQLLYKTERL